MGQDNAIDPKKVWAENEVCKKKTQQQVAGVRVRDPQTTTATSVGSSAPALSPSSSPTPLPVTEWVGTACQRLVWHKADKTDGHHVDTLSTFI